MRFLFVFAQRVLEGVVGLLAEAALEPLLLLAFGLLIDDRSMAHALMSQQRLVQPERLATDDALELQTTHCVHTLLVVLQATKRPLQPR